VPAPPAASPEARAIDDRDLHPDGAARVRDGGGLMRGDLARLRARGLEPALVAA
jgi:hypothetical protein